MDYAHKVSLYLESGVREYWIVDPLKKCTTVYLNEQDPSEFAPCIINQNGVQRVLELSLSEQEMEKFGKSCKTLRESFEGIV